MAVCFEPPVPIALAWGRISRFLDAMDTHEATVLAGYAAAADVLRDAYSALEPAEVLAPVLTFLPAVPASVVDIGAGTGRIAGWLQSQGYQVHAVEPVVELRDAPHIAWHSDTLPDLGRISGAYDLVLCLGVLHHLPPRQQLRAVRRMAVLVPSSGKVILSLRHGPCAASRPGFAVDPAKAISVARDAGLTLALQKTCASIQRANRTAGVMWTWLVLERS